jgi:hypothetical protein
VSGFHPVQASAAVPGLVAQEIRAYCPAGTLPLGGGYTVSMNQDLQANIRVSRSTSVSDNNGNYWAVVVLNFNDPNAAGTTANVTVDANCVIAS